MSVYKRTGSSTYSFDFQAGGRRFSGDTCKATKREAVAEERLRRSAAKLEIDEHVSTPPSLGSWRHLATGLRRLHRQLLSCKRTKR